MNGLRRALLLPLTVLTLAASAAGAQTASLVRDLNPSGSFSAASDALLLVPGKVFFSASGVWVSDGTPAGTRALSEDNRLVTRMIGALGGVALWTDTDSEAGLWRSDGTRAGTYRLDDPAAYFVLRPDGVFVGGVFITLGCTEAIRCELWRTDGTAAGTRRLLDHGPDRVSSFTVVGSRAFFVGYDTSSEPALWVSDGTAAGTREILRFQGLYAPRNLIPVENRIFFVAPSSEGDEVWTSDGTAAGTQTVTHFPQDLPFGNNAETLVMKAVGRRVYFIPDDSVHSVELWQSDGTAAGTFQLTDFNDDVPFSHGIGLDSVQGLAGDRIVFLASSHGSGSIWTAGPTPRSAAPLACSGACPPFPASTLYGDGRRAVFFSATSELWGTDGTAAGTVKLRGACTAPSCPRFPRPQPWPQGIAFVGWDAAHGTEIWLTDGTPAGTRRLTDVPGPEIELGDNVPAAVTDGRRVLIAAPVPGGEGLWIQDAAGTRLFTALPQENASSDPQDLEPFGDGLLFAACAGMPQAIWRTSGTAESTAQLTENIPPSCSPSYRTADLTVAGGLAFFPAGGVHDSDLWRTDGTPQGTFKIADERVQLSSMAAFQGKLFFPAAGLSVWRSDGTAAGTVEAFRVPGENRPPDILGLTAAGGWLYFIVRNEDIRSEVWRSDGTQAGLALVGTFDRITPRFVALGSQVFFAADDTLWRTDGTSAGTVALAYDPADLTIAQGALYFISLLGFDAGKLWRTDGTLQGTVPLGTFVLPTFESTAYITEAAGKVFFMGGDRDHGVELWSTDGTPAGTHRVRDISPGSSSSNPRWLAAAGGLLYFAASDGVHGAELWRSDGTDAGTRLVHDIAPDAVSSSPEQLTAAGNRLYFTADDGASGRELWSLPLSPEPCQPAADHLCLNGSRYRVEAAWRTPQGAQGRGTAVALTGDTGYFWFFNAANVEAVIKVLDGQGVNGHVWVFYGALSDVSYTLTVTDTQTGLTRRYFNPQGQLASVGDTQGFGPLGANAAHPRPPVSVAPPSPLPLITERTGKAASCQAGAERLCLNNGRFAVEVAWKDFQGHTGKGRTLPLTGDTGAFWFFNADNLELMVKALDGRPVNGKFWVFYGALSNVEYTVTVTDTQTGKMHVYKNPSGRFASVADTNAF
jgi:ELWxxDGT repeat protein